MLVRLVRWWGPVVVYMVLIFTMSSRSRPGLFATAPDYLLHAAAYFLLAVLSVRAFAEGLAQRASGAALWAGVALAIVYGMSDEWHQAYVPGRDASVTDVVADGVGSLSAIVALGLFWRVKGMVAEAKPQRALNHEKAKH